LVSANDIDIASISMFSIIPAKTTCFLIINYIGTPSVYRINCERC
jgi:hypothetical protein